MAHRQPPVEPIVARPEWQLVFVLPNLHLEEHHLSPSELTLGLEGIAIVPAADPRVVALTEWSDPAATFLGAFHDGNGMSIEPSALIVRNDWLRDMNRDVEPIIAFRNAVALSSVLLTRAYWPGDGWLGASWSDTFDYHAAQLRPDGSKFDLWTPALNSIGFRLQDLSLTPDVRLARNHLGPIDDHLAARLGRAWKTRYRQRRRLRVTGKVFRSLEAAYAACGLRFRNYSSLDEVGLGAVNWATAMEVLASPQGRDVHKWDCIHLIGKGRQRPEAELSHRRYRVSKRAKPGRPQRFHSMNLAQWIYYNLHAARSKFVHGDTVSPRLLMPFGEDAPPLLSLASTVYRIALVAYLEGQFPWPMSIDDLVSLDLVSGMKYRDHLMAVFGEDL